MYPHYHTCLLAHLVKMFREVIPPHPKVTGAHTLNFGTIFEFLSLKIVRGSLSSMLCALTSLAHSVAHV